MKMTLCGTRNTCSVLYMMGGEQTMEHRVVGIATF